MTEIKSLILYKQTQQRPVSKATLNKYIKQYEFMTNLYNKNDDWITKSTETQLINLIRKMEVKPTGKLNYLNIFFMIKSMNEQPSNEISKYRETLFKQKDRQTETKIQEKKEQNLPSYDEVNQFIDELYKTGDWIRWLYNYLIFTYGFRNKDVNLNIIQADKYNKLDDKQKKELNYLLVKKTETEIIINDYKTKSTHGAKHIKCRSRKLLKVCQLLKDGSILVKSNGANVSNDELSYYIRLFQNEEHHLTEADYFKINLLNIQTKPNSLNLLQQIAKTRGTNSIINLDKYYNLNDE